MTPGVIMQEKAPSAAPKLLVQRDSPRPASGRSGGPNSRSDVRILSSALIACTRSKSHGARERRRRGRPVATGWRRTVSTHRGLFFATHDRNPFVADAVHAYARSALTVEEG